MTWCLTQREQTERWDAAGSPAIAAVTARLAELWREAVPVPAGRADGPAAPAA